MENQRKKIEDRKDFTYDEKLLIGKKSDNKCCCCGKIFFPNYGATVDHFVPISKGGTNDDANLIMLCENCNEEKGNFVTAPIGKWTKYLNKEHKKLLEEYFENYIDNFSFINRNNVFFADEIPMEYIDYELASRFNPQIMLKQIRKSKKHKTEHPSKNFTRVIYLKKTNIKDIFKIKKYIENSCKKNNIDMISDEIHLMLEAFYRFGCVYTIEKNNEIMFAFSIIVSTYELKNEGVEIPDSMEKKIKSIINKIHINDDDLDLISPPHFDLIIFPYYNTKTALTLEDSIITKVTDLLVEWNKIPFCPVNIYIPTNSRLNEYVYFCNNIEPSERNNYFDVYRFLGVNEDLLSEDENKNIIGRKSYSGEEICNNKEVMDFFKKLDDENISLYVYNFFNEIENEQLKNRLKWLREIL